MVSIKGDNVSYSIKRATLISDQLERLATQNAHQVAGQVANLAFWISEAVHAISTIDDYPVRFRRLRDAQVGWVKAHGTEISGYCPHCGGACEFGPQTPEPPQRIPTEDLAAARDGVRRAARRYLLRLYQAHFLDEDGVRRACAEIGVGVETEDFDRDSTPIADEGPVPTDMAPRRRKRSTMGRP
jgi:hypothetical protein